MNNPKRHHYVPQFYLKNFTNSKGLLQIFDREKNEYRQQNPLNTAVQGHYYTFRTEKGKKHTEIEKLFSTIEDKAKLVIDKIDARENIAVEEKESLATFISFQKTRVPDFEKNINKLSEKLFKKNIQKTSSHETVASFIKEYEKNTDKKLNISPEELFEISQNENRYSIEFIREWSLTMAIRLGRDSIKYFLDMDWIFLQVPKKASFITSDNPFALVPPSNYDPKSLYGVGLITPGAKKQIPLSQRTCLVMTDHGQNILSREIDRELVRKVNLITAINSDRFLIARDITLLKNIVKITKVNERKKKERVRVI